MQSVMTVSRFPGRLVFAIILVKLGLFSFGLMIGAMFLPMRSWKWCRNILRRVCGSTRRNAGSVATGEEQHGKSHRNAASLILQGRFPGTLV